jgi:hypothetical protein
LVLGSGTLKADRPAYLSRNIYRFLRPLGFGATSIKAPTTSFLQDSNFAQRA